MKDKILTIDEIVKWYALNVDVPISVNFMIYLVTEQLLKPINKTCYSLNALNNLMLESKNGKYIQNTNGKYCMKKNRVSLVNQYDDKQEARFKFKITKMNGNHLKLIKIK